MTFNFITNIQTCFDLVKTSVDVSLIYYSHIPAAIVSMIIGMLVLLKNRNLLAKILFSLSMTFSVWTIFSLITWTSYNSISYMFFWSFFGILTALISILSLYLVFVYVNGRDVNYLTKIFWLILFLPIIIISPTIYNLPTFDGVWCVPNETSLFNYYYYFFGIIAIIGIVYIYVKKNKTNVKNRKELNFFIIGIECFLLMFLSTDFVASYLVDNGYLNNYNLAPYGLFGMVIFMASLAYIIVEFKAFSIKLVGAQALVWGLIILIGSQLFYIKEIPTSVLIIIVVTLIISAIMGYFLVVSVKKEDELNEQLAIANAGQTNLIHIMNHQIKGYLSISKNIFAELLTDDYGKVPEEAKDLISQGLENADKGTKYVTAVLKGESAENGKLVFDMKPFDLKKLTSEVVAKEKEVAEKKGLKLSFDVDGGDYNIMGDIAHLGEAVRNLIDNSINYTPAGSISINLSINGKNILFKVKDTGVGVKEEDKSKLFKAGGVGSDSIKINTNSSGYGLAFVKGVIENHKGKVWFESEGAGKGSTFYIELPAK